MNNQNVYIVMHNEGIDGNYVQAVFSNYKDAQKLAEMFNKTSEADNDYNFYSVYKVKVNKFDIKKFKLITKDNWTTLQYDEEDFL